MSAILRLLRPPKITPIGGRFVYGGAKLKRCASRDERRAEIVAWLRVQGEPRTASEVSAGVDYQKIDAIQEMLNDLVNAGEVELGSTLVHGRARLTYRTTPKP